MSQETLSVERILRTPFPSYHKPLGLARALNRSGDEAKRDDALTLLEGLLERYPHVLAIGQEYLLALIECDRHDRAERALRALENTFANLDEETLCRWGRLFKDRGDDCLELPGAVSNKFPPNREMAAKFYRKALEKYEAAYGIRSGHYPGINKATMLLIVGSLKAEQTGQAPGASPPRELLESVDLAGELLENRGSWTTDQPHDEAVWHPATQGEAHLLRREWAQAADLYREATHAREIGHLARESMRRQVDRILLAFRNLGIAIPPPFDDAAASFAPGSTTSSGKAAAAAGAAGPSRPRSRPMSGAGEGDTMNAYSSPRESGSG